MITLPQGFDIGSKEAVDKRLVMTKEEMASILKGEMPDNYICVCSTDGKLYIYNSAFEKTNEIGRFRLYEELLDLPAAITKGIESPEGKAALEEAMSKTLPGAMKEVMADENTAKEMADTMFDSEQFSVNAENKIYLAIETLEATDGID